VSAKKEGAHGGTLDSPVIEWGIEPVPERLRVLGLGDTVLLWGNLAVSLLVIVAGALLVPALSLKEALLAIVVASVVGSVMLGAAAAVGTDARVPAMVLMRAPLGQRGSYLATALNVVQCLGWSVYELIIIASACAALSDRVFHFRAQWLWTLLFGAVAIVLAFLGPIGFVRRYVRKFAIWFVLASLGYLTWWVIDKSDLTAFWDGQGKGGFPTFWQGVDLTLASVISWTPLAADYTRFTRTRRSSFWGTAVGYLVDNATQLQLRDDQLAKLKEIDGSLAARNEEIETQLRLIEKPDEQPPAGPGAPPVRHNNAPGAQTKTTADSAKLHKARAANDAAAIQKAFALLDPTQQTTARTLLEARGIAAPGSQIKQRSRDPEDGTPLEP